MDEDVAPLFYCIGVVAVVVMYIFLLWSLSSQLYEQRITNQRLKGLRTQLAELTAVFCPRPPPGKPPDPPPAPVPKWQSVIPADAVMDAVVDADADAIKSAPPVYCPKCEQPSVAEADRCQACGWPLT